MQPAEKNKDSATQSGRRGDNDGEVISTTSSVSAEHPVDGQETVSTNKKIEKMVEVLHCKVGDARHQHGRVEVLPYSSHQSRRQASETSRHKETTHGPEVNFNKTTPFVKEETAKELQNHAVKTQDS